MWKLQESVLEKQDKEKLAEFLKSTDRYTQFEKVKQFEKEWSQWQGCKYSVFVNSGSSADLIMLDSVKEYYNIPDESEVLVPAVTWVTNITSVIQSKLKPVFVDINLNDLSFNYIDLEKAITPKTKIILLTHLIGLPANIATIKAIAEKHSLIVLEDCCESHGARVEGEKIGNFGLASTFSFYWGHHMTTVEGGMLCTNNDELNDLFILKRSHGLARELDPSKHDKYKRMYNDIDFNFLFLTHGYNFRNTELHAVIGIAQIKNIDNYISIRNSNHKEYIKIIGSLADKLYILNPIGISSFCLPFLFKKTADSLILKKKLLEHNIEFRPVIGGNLLRQPCFKAFGNYLDFPNADLLHRNGFYIGNNQFVDNKRLDLLNDILKEVF